MKMVLRLTDYLIKTFPEGYVKMPRWLTGQKFLDQTVLEWIAAAIVLVLVFALRRPVAKGLSRLFGRIRSKGKPIGKQAVDCLIPILGWLLPLIGWWIITTKIFALSGGFYTFARRITVSLIIVIAAMIIDRLVAILLNYTTTEHMEHGLPNSVANFYHKLIRVFIGVLAVVAILSVFKIEIAGIITGLGIGGLAISLAAKDTLSNLIAGLAIMSDRIFEPGDMIETPEIEGVVEEIGFRSSRVRDYEQSLISVPNTKLADNFVWNLTKRKKRRIRLYLCLSRQVTQDNLAAVMTDLREYLEVREYVLADQITIRVDRIEPEGIYLMVQWYLSSTDWDLYMKEKDHLLTHFWETAEAKDLAIDRTVLEWYNVKED